MTVGYVPSPYDFLTHTTTPPAPTLGYPEDPKNGHRDTKWKGDANRSQVAGQLQKQGPELIGRKEPLKQKIGQNVLFKVVTMR